jgi:hypothetical protein
VSQQEASMSDLVESNLARVDSLRRQRNWLLIALAVLAVTLVFGVVQVHDYGKRIDKGVTTIIDGRQTRRIACKVLRNQGDNDPACDGLIPTSDPAAPSTTNRLICDQQKQWQEFLGTAVSPGCAP